MKRFLTFLMAMAFCGVAYANPITVDQFLSPDDVTIAHLEALRTSCVNAINNADGNLLQYRSVSPDKLTLNADVTVFRDEAMNDWVYSGLLPATSATLTSNISSGVAYVGGDRLAKDAYGNTYTASKWTWVDLKSDGSYVFTEGNIGDADPAISANTTRLARVSTDGTTIQAVRDDRIMSITLENRQADFLRAGLQMRGSNATTDVVQIMPGVVYHGNVRVCKTTMTTLGLLTAGDWVAGGGSASDNTTAFVVTNNAGSIKLTTTAPTYHDLAGTTIGTKWYSKVGSNYYRVIAWVYMCDDYDGGVKINPWEWGNFSPDMPWATVKNVSPDHVTTSAFWVDVPDTQIDFYSSGRPIKVRARGDGYSTTQHYAFDMGIEIDGVPMAETETSQSSTQTNKCLGGGGGGMFTEWVTPELTAGNHNAKICWKQENGYTAHFLRGTIVVEEY